MRRSMMIAVAAAALVWAQGGRADDAAKDAKQDAQHAGEHMKQGAQRTGERAKESASDARTSAESSMQRQDQAGSAAARRDEKQHPMFGGKDNFDVKGKIQKVAGTSITILRDDLPAATLNVTKETKIELNGDTATLSQLKPGEDVKASFNLKGDKPEAVEIKAERNK